MTGAPEVTGSAAMAGNTRFYLPPIGLGIITSPMVKSITRCAQTSALTTMHDGLRRWMEDSDTNERRCLYDPVVGHRLEAEIDDHGEVYPMALEGPDIKIAVTLPGLAADIAIFLQQKRAHGGQSFPGFLDSSAATGKFGRISGG